MWGRRLLVFPTLDEYLASAREGEGEGDFPLQDQPDFETLKAQTE
jgi:hypothetical protein